MDNDKTFFVEVVIYDPDNYDTYPSICATPDDVKDRFGFVGGEKLVFTRQGSYLGQLVKEVNPL